MNVADVIKLILALMVIEGRISVHPTILEDFAHRVELEVTQLSTTPYGMAPQLPPLHMVVMTIDRHRYMLGI